MTDPQQQSLADYGRTLIALHRKGYAPARGYCLAEKDDQFGRGAITVQAVCLPPEPKAARPAPWLLRSVVFAPKEVGMILGAVGGLLLGRLMFLFFTR